MDYGRIDAEHKDISRMCLKLGHNFVKVKNILKSNNNYGDVNNLVGYKKQENQNLEKINKEQVNCNNNIPHNTEKETLKLQADRKLFDEINQLFQADSFRKIPPIKPNNEEENIQLYFEVQVKPEFQDNNGKKQQISESDLKLDLKIAFESEEEDHEQKFDENTDKERKDFGKLTKVKFCNKNLLEEIESQPKNKKRKLIKEQHCENVEDIDIFQSNECIIEVNCEKDLKSKEKVKSTKSNEELKKKIETEMKKSNIDFEKMIQENSNILAYHEGTEKFINNIGVSIQELFKPIVEKIDKVYSKISTYMSIEKCNDEVHTEIHKDVNKITQQGLNDEIPVVSQVVDGKNKYTVDGCKITMFEKGTKLDFHNENKTSNNGELVLNFNEKVIKEVLEETKTYHGVKENKQEKFKEMVETEEPFDLVILYNSDQKNIDKIIQHNVNVRQINYNEEIIAKFEENHHQNVQKISDHQGQELYERTKSEPKKQIKEDLCLQFCFFSEEGNTSLTSSVVSSDSITEKNSSAILKSVLDNEEQVKLNENSCIQKYSQEDSDMDVETLSDTVDDSERKIQKKFKVNTETSKKEISVSPEDSYIYKNELIKQDFDEEKKTKVNENYCVQEFSSEDSDVDIETFSETEKEILIETEICFETSEEESILSSNSSFDEDDYCNSFNKCVEINEVIEIVEEYEIVNGHKSVEGNKYLTDVKSSPSKHKNHEKINKDINDQHKHEKSQLQIENLIEVEDSNKRIKNTQKLNEALRKQITEELHLQSNTINENMELELKNNRPLSHYQVDDELQNTLIELNFNLLNTKQNVYSFLDQNLSVKHLQKRYKKKSLETFNLPTILNKLTLIEENIVKFEKDFNELKSEFQHCLELEENDLNPMQKKKSPNLYERLFAIHKTQLAKYSESSTWPQNCLSPSSLLDKLFEDPNEDKPNVLLFTLYPINIGYSVKICMQMNQLIHEYWYNYENDDILCFVEQQKLPPSLLNLLDKAKPNLFYGGRIIAEIHDMIYDTPGKIFRIMLYPNHQSIQFDISKLIKENSQIKWTNYKKMKLESLILQKSFPFTVGGTSPIVGSTILMQNQLLSCRSICLNPLTNDFTTFESESLNTNLYYEHETSDSMDLVDDEKSILLQFGFHPKSSNIDILILIILPNMDLFKSTLLLCSNVEVKPVTLMKVETQFGQDKLNDLIAVLLEVLRQKLSNDLEVTQTNKYDKYPFHTLKISPTLPEDIVCGITHANISKLIDKFLVNICINHLTTENYVTNVLESEIDPLQFKLVVDPEKLSKNIQNIDETYLNLQTDHKIKKSIHFCSTKKMSKNSSKYLDLTNMMSGRDRIVESLPLKCERTPLLSDILCVKPLSPKSSSENTETNSDVNLSVTSSFFFDDSNDNKIHVVQDQFKLQPIPIMIYCITSLPIDPKTTVSYKTSIMSSSENSFFHSDIQNNIESIETSVIDSFVPNNLQFLTNRETLTTPIPLMKYSISSLPIDQKTTVSSTTSIVSSSENSFFHSDIQNNIVSIETSTTLIPIMTYCTASLSIGPKTTVSYKTLIMSSSENFIFHSDIQNNIESIETSDSSVPNNLQFLNDEPTLTRPNDYEPETRLESVMVPPNEHSINIGDPTIHELGYEECLPTTSNDYLEMEFSQEN